MHFVAQTLFVFIFFIVIRLNYVLIIITILIFVILFFFSKWFNVFFILIKSLIFLKNILQNSRIIFFVWCFFFIIVFIETQYYLIIEKNFMNFSAAILFCTQISQNKNVHDLLVLKKFWINNFSNFKKSFCFFAITMFFRFFQFAIYDFILFFAEAIFNRWNFSCSCKLIFRSNRL